MTHPGCVLCGLVRSCGSGSNPSSPVLSPQDSTTPLASSSRTPSLATSFADSGVPGPYHHPFERTQSPAPDGRRTGNRVGGREIVYHDKDITVYKAEGKERLCQGGRHIIIVVNEHLQSVYEFGASDIPLLSHILDTAAQILNSVAAAGDDLESGKGKEKLHVGFVGSIIKDPQSPHAHLHAHAYLTPIDTKLSGASLWRRNVVFGSLNWWSIEDLRAEIRQATSNNRVKTGYEYRQAPIDKVPDAGAAIAPAYALNPTYSDVPSPVSQSKQHALQQQQPQPSSYRPQPGPSSVSKDRLSPLPTHPLEEVGSIESVVSMSTVTPQTSNSGRTSREDKGKGKEQEQAISDWEEVQYGSEGSERLSDRII
ncbi:hypothetical protein CNBA2230 [Cryptococcus deneoformans B-3501A]|uniref:hypothetical protein n=1 Tax=Cryptococcus deneoformans (strain B-3501A) TaxID=283643 RepID=UPI000042F3D1|nr:hypothetical protein CNBA2230 [Cryptococcus neoformans var. neoformans B-3501A]EAL23576.1 hypothetical protein CNBA2230 [Cryptococcus neoformans var. neoformans B-3501A]